MVSPQVAGATGELLVVHAHVIRSLSRGRLGVYDVTAQIGESGTPPSVNPSGGLDGGQRPLGIRTAMRAITPVVEGVSSHPHNAAAGSCEKWAVDLELGRHWVDASYRESRRSGYFGWEAGIRIRREALFQAADGAGLLVVTA